MLTIYLWLGLFISTANLGNSNRSVCLRDSISVSASTRFQILRITLAENLNVLWLRCLVLVRGWARRRRPEKGWGTYTLEVSHISYSLLVLNVDLLDISERLSTRTSDLGSVGNVNILTWGRARRRTAERSRDNIWNVNGGQVGTEQSWRPQSFPSPNLAYDPKRFNMAATVYIIISATLKPIPKIHVQT